MTDAPPDDVLDVAVTPVTLVPAPDAGRELEISVDVVVSRVGRKRCPRCRRLRVLFRLTAYSAAQPVGYGSSRCLACAGLRPR